MKKDVIFPTSLLEPPPDITGHEKSFFTQLINQSEKTEIKDSKSAFYSAKEHLNKHSFVINSCRALKGFHTHNAKIYDAKVKARVFAQKPPFIANSPYIYSDTILYHHFYGWSGNAAYISKMYFLCSEFLRKGVHTTLYHEFLKKSSELVNILMSMGLSKTNVDIIRGACLKHSQSPFPDSVPPYQVQLLIPFANEGEAYIALSPIASSSVQAAIHNFCRSKDADPINCDYHHLLRPENIGALATATGGSIAILSPRLNLQNKSSLSTTQIIKTLMDNNDLFVTSELDFSFFLAVRKKADFSINRYFPAPLSAEKAKILNRVGKNITSLFSKLDKIRTAYQLGQVDKSAISMLKSSQRCYVSESKLSTEEMHAIWQEANFVTQNLIASSSYKQLSFHPTLTRYISDGIRNHLKSLYRGKIEPAKPQLNITDNVAENPQHTNVCERPSKTYIFVPQLSVFNAHADNSPYSSGLPSITAVVGYTDRLCRNIKKSFNISMCEVKVAWLLHSFQRTKGIKKHEPARWNDKSKTALADVVSRKFCNLTFDLIIECDTEKSELERVKRFLPECLPTQFASGVVNTPEELSSTDWQPETFQIYATIGALLDSIQRKAFKRWAVADYSSEFERQSDSVLCDLSLLYSNHKVDSLLSISGVGYKILEKPWERPGARLELHAYGEPVVGIQELRPVEHSSVNILEELPLFWSYKREENLILCKAVPSRTKSDRS